MADPVIAAPSSEASSVQQFLPYPKVSDVPSNTHVFWFDDTETRRGYGAHQFCPNGQRVPQRGAIFVTWRDGHWRHLPHRSGDAYPYLGGVRDEIAQFDTTTPSPAEFPLITEVFETPDNLTDDHSADDPDIVEDTITDQTIRAAPISTDILTPTRTRITLPADMATNTPTATTA